MEIKFITEGMACSKCEARVTERLSSMPGVSSVVATASDAQSLSTAKISTATSWRRPLRTWATTSLSNSDTVHKKSAFPAVQIGKADFLYHIFFFLLI